LSANWLFHSLLVGAGGFVGSILRFGVGGLTYRLFPAATLPYGTLVVNVVGCLAIGILGGVGDARQIGATEVRLFLFLGLLGGFTTFSAFGYESLALFRADEPLRAALNVGLHIVLGLSAVWLGYSVGDHS
jgi:CrcB protein